MKFANDIGRICSVGIPTLCCAVLVWEGGYVLHTVAQYQHHDTNGSIVLLAILITMAVWSALCLGILSGFTGSEDERPYDYALCKGAIYLSLGTCLFLTSAYVAKDTRSFGMDSIWAVSDAVFVLVVWIVIKAVQSRRTYSHSSC